MASSIVDSATVPVVFSDDGVVRSTIVIVVSKILVLLSLVGSPVVSSVRRAVVSLDIVGVRSVVSNPIFVSVALGAVDSVVDSVFNCEVLSVNADVGSVLSVVTVVPCEMVLLDSSVAVVDKAAVSLVEGE